MGSIEMNRRQFVSIAGIGAGALAAMGLMGCQTPKAQAGDESNGKEESASWLGEAPEIAEDQIVKTETTDLLIVGAGNAGMVAAATAADLDMDFLLCDKAGAVQATRHFAGAIDSKWQKEAGVETDKGKLLNELTRYASGKCSQDVWKVWINESGETFEYVHDIMAAAGMDIYLDTDGYDHPTGGTDFYVPPQQHMWYLPDVADAAPPLPFGAMLLRKPDSPATKSWQTTSHPRATRSRSAIRWRSSFAKKAVALPVRSSKPVTAMFR